jgi:hypothetical protein
MHSSTSSSDRSRRFDRKSAERLTAADRPGVAQPVPERPVPVKPWGNILLTVAVLVVVATAAWEWRMRELNLLPGDVRDTPSLWANQRRRVDSEDIQVAIVGDSRILFDTDLDRFEALTGVRPLQLALAGTPARPFFAELAADPDFKGLALVGIAEGSYFRQGPGLYDDALARYRFESPAQRASFLLYRRLSHLLGFLDRDYRVSALLLRLDPGLRPGTRGPYDEPWKFSTTGDDRQTALWSRIETDAYLNGHARALWARGYTGPPLASDAIAMTQKTTRDAVAAIRSRGGDVIFLRPPSRGPYRINEARTAPRDRVWDALLAFAEVRGLHADDDPVASHLFLPELSHLSRACSTVYTDSYVRRLTLLTPRLTLRSDAPAPLAPSDCPPTDEALAVQGALGDGLSGSMQRPTGFAE